MKTYPTLNEALQKVVGTRVLSVDFVEDYVQLGWAISFLTAYMMPTIDTAGVKYNKESPEFHQVMCQLEGQLLERAEVAGDNAVTFLFASGTFLSISLRDDDYVGPEALLYQEIGGLLWVA